MIAAIRDAHSKGLAGEAVAGSRHFYALPLLIEFRCREALPAIMELLALPLQLQDDLYGDSMTELMPNALAVMADQQPELIDLSCVIFRLIRMCVGWRLTAFCIWSGTA